MFRSNYINYTGQPPTLTIYRNSKLFLVLGNIVCWFSGVLIFVATIVIVRARYIKWNQRVTKSILFDMYNKHRIQSKINKISKDVKK